MGMATSVRTHDGLKLTTGSKRRYVIFRRYNGEVIDAERAARLTGRYFADEMMIPARPFQIEYRTDGTLRAEGVARSLRGRTYRVVVIDTVERKVVSDTDLS